MAEEVFMDSDLMKVACSVLEKAATTDDKDYAKLAAQYSRLITDRETNRLEQERLDFDREIEESRLAAEKKDADRRHKLEIVKLIAFVSVSVGGVAIENKYMVSSWFQKTFLQKMAPRV